MKHKSHRYHVFPAQKRGESWLTGRLMYSTERVTTVEAEYSLCQMEARHKVCKWEVA